MIGCKIAYFVLGTSKITIYNLQKDKRLYMMKFLTMLIYMIKSHFVIAFLSPKNHNKQAYLLNMKQHAKQRGNAYRGKALTQSRKNHLLELSNRPLH